MARTQTFDWLTTAILAALLLIVPIVFVLALNPGLLDELQREFAGTPTTVASVGPATGSRPETPASPAPETLVSTPVGSSDGSEKNASVSASPKNDASKAASPKSDAAAADLEERSILEKPVADDPVGDEEAGTTGPSSTAPALAVPPEMPPALTDPDADGDAGGLQPLDGAGTGATGGSSTTGTPTPALAAPGPLPGPASDEAAAPAAGPTAAGAVPQSNDPTEVEEEILREIRALVTSQRALESQFDALRKEIDGRLTAMKASVDEADRAAPAASSAKETARATRAAKILRATLEGRLVVPLGDDAGSTIEFVYVPPGRYRMGRTADEDRAAIANTVAAPAQEVIVDRGFFVSRTEITDGQYAAFLQANYGDDPKLDAVLKAREDSDKPAAKATWPFAKFFCLWVAKESGFDVRLPTEVEWEYVARGPQSVLRLEPAEGAGAADGGVQDVDSTLEDRSWCGAVDLWGNVAEWCADVYSPTAFDAVQSGVAQVYVPSASPADWSETDAEARSVRGGSFADAAETRDPSERRRAKPDTSAASVGFRVVLIPDFDGQVEVGAMP